MPAKGLGGFCRKEWKVTAPLPVVLTGTQPHPLQFASVQARSVRRQDNLLFF